MRLLIILALLISSLFINGCSLIMPKAPVQANATSVSTAGDNKTTTPATSQPSAVDVKTTSQSVVSSSLANLDAILTAADFQYLNASNQRKVVISILNTSNYIFTGKVKILYRDKENQTQGTETVVVDQLYPGATLSPVLFAKPNATLAEFKPSGSFLETPKSKVDSNSYTIIYTQSETNSQTLYIKPAAIDENTLTGIIRDQREKLQSSNIKSFRILFYDPGYKGQQGELPISSDNNTASAEVNYTTGLSEMYLINSGKAVIIK